MLEDLANFIGIISNDGISAKEFNKKLIGAIGIKDRGQLADYFTFDTPSGKVSLRLSSHYFHARTYRGKSNKAEKNVSLVITIPGVDKGKFKADRRVELVEYVYDSPNLERLNRYRVLFYEERVKESDYKHKRIHPDGKVVRGIKDGYVIKSDVYVVESAS